MLVVPCCVTCGVADLGSFLAADTEKMLKLSDRLVLLSAGPQGDAVHFGEFIQKNLKLQAIM